MSQVLSSHMRGEDHVVEGVERVVGFRRLSFLDVEACACDLVLFKRFDQSRFIDESTAGGVDQEAVGFISARVSLLIRCFVCGVNGQCRET